MKNRFGKTIPWRSMIAAAAATAFLASVGATSAFAATAASADGYVTGASPRPPAPGLEMLGISDVECDPAGISAVLGQQTWASPKFYIMGSADYNSNPNPYFVNAVINYNDAQAGGPGNIAQPTAVVGGNKTVRTETKSAGGNPDAGLAVYGFSDDVNALWDLKPDVIMGTAAGTCDYTSAKYRDPLIEANADKFRDYAPKSVTYKYTEISDIIDSMYNLAIAADQVVAESNGAKKLRYNTDAMSVAKNYEKYIHGLQGYLLSRLNADNADKKTVAIVMAVDGEGNYTLMNETSGSATALRYLEVVRNVSKNLADELSTTTVTADQLAKADMIILNTTVTDTGSMLGGFTADMQKKTYYATSQGVGCLYSVARNSVDNAQDMGRILGCLYPNYIDQDQLIAYYYDEFYHVRSEKLGDLMAKAMTGVVNWDSTDVDRTVWTEDDAAGYKKADVQEKLDQGIAYIQQLNADDVPAALVLNKDAEGKGYIEPIEYKDPNAKPDPVAQTITTAKSTWSVTYGGASFSLGAKAKTALTYKTSNAKVVTVGSTGRVYIKGAGTATITVSAKATDQYKAATKKVTVKVAKKGQSLTVSTAKKTAAKGKYTSAVTVKGAKTSKSFKKVSGSKYLTVTSTGKIKVSAKAKRGATYSVKVKVSVRESANYKAGSKTATIKVKVK
ncbi:MAG: hypothetical protein Q4D06_00980 [Coriobacteriia bacterium]|nr:hypothetical protein [Coriobacteriia bacterium]